MAATGVDFCTPPHSSRFASRVLLPVALRAAVTAQAPSAALPVEAVAVLQFPSVEAIAVSVGPVGLLRLLRGR
eukprot:5715394-Amphidinium_carterae.1